MNSTMQQTQNRRMDSCDGVMRGNMEASHPTAALYLEVVSLQASIVLITTVYKCEDVTPFTGIGYLLCKWHTQSH